MGIRIATFNVENLFSRPIALDFDSWSEGQPALDDYVRFNSLIAKDAYAPADKATLLEIMNRRGLTSAHANTDFYEFRDIRGDFALYGNGQALEIVADGRNNWLGWLDLRRVDVEHEAIRNTGRVIAEVAPDILILVEVEDRITLERFYRQTVWPQLEAQGHEPHSVFMLVDGNDDRGIDIGLISRFPLIGMRSNVHRRARSGRPLFSRDCIEFYIDVGKPDFLAVLGNHFASKASDRTGRRRQEQSEGVARIVDDLRRRTPWVAVAGDLNDHPQGGSLDGLLRHPELRDAMSLPLYTGERPGTYKTAAATGKLDYLLLSTDLQPRVRQVDVNRRGYYSTLWEPFEDIKAAPKERRELLQASDHHCLWADLDLD